MSSQLIFFSLSFASHPNSNRDTSGNFIRHLSIEHFIFPHQHFQKAGHVPGWPPLTGEVGRGPLFFAVIAAHEFKDVPCIIFSDILIGHSHQA